MYFVLIFIKKENLFTLHLIRDKIFILYLFSTDEMSALENSISNLQEECRDKGAKLSGLEAEREEAVREVFVCFDVATL